MDSSFYRTLDANINRAMEGVRVCEDILRFSLNSDYSGEFKDMRHSIRKFAMGFPEHALLRSRDVNADMQKFRNTVSEMERANLHDIFSANIHRAIEALRVLEEISKLSGSSSPEMLQEIRFRLYELEKLAVLGSVKEGNIKKFRKSLYAILDSQLSGSAPLSETAGRLIDGGASVIQLRMKGEPSSHVLKTAREISEICRKNQRLFIVNDYPDIALLSDADGLHLGRDDIPVREARKLLPDDFIIGISTHSLEQAEEALADSPDYVAIGPVYDTSSKQGDPVKGIGAGVLKKVREITGIPLVAIGGISKDNIKTVVENGADSIAVISALYKEGKIEENCSRLLKVIG